MSNLNYSLDTRLLAYMADKLAYLVWFKTKDGFKGINRPQSILSALLNEEEGNAVITCLLIRQKHLKSIEIKY